MTNSRLTDPEVLEGRFPVLLREFSLRTGSGGNGEYHGGDGLVREVEFRETMTAAILSNHRRIAPFGLAGGEPGRCGVNRLERRDGSSETCRRLPKSRWMRAIVSGSRRPAAGGMGERLSATADGSARGSR